jgi:CRP-like cAMP-binding protein
MAMRTTAQKEFTDFFATYPKRFAHKGEIIHAPGEMPRVIHFVESGFVKLYALSPEGNEKLLVMLMPGEVFSLTSVFLNQPTSFYAEVLQDAQLRAAPRQAFIDFVHTDVKLMDCLVLMLIKVLAVVNNRVFTLSLTRAYDRLLSRLAVLAEVFGVEQPDGSIVIKAPMTHQEIANSINLSRESTSKEMHRLQTEGVLEYGSGTIVIHKPEKLRGPTT